MESEIRRIDGVKKENMLVVTVLKGKGTSDDMCRHVIQYYKEHKDGSYNLLFEEDPCKQKE